MTINGSKKLVSCEIKFENVEYYNIITNYHMNCYANNVLTSTSLNNIYPMQDMKFIKESREPVLYEEFSDLPIEFYTGLRIRERGLEDLVSLKKKILKLIIR
jgi:hypothetical protein